MAGETGSIAAMLLAELEVEHLSETYLGELCWENHNHLLRIPVLDAIIGKALNTMPIPVEMDIDERPPLANSTRFGTVIEISSVHTSAGKTHLLYYITAMCVLPETSCSIQLHGRSSSIIIIDNDGRFDVSRLFTIMLSHVLSCYKESGLDIPDSGAEAVVKDSLQHVHLFRPQNLAEVVKVLQGLPDYYTSPRYGTLDRSLGGILIDSLSAFYWPEKLANSVSEGSDTGSHETYETMVRLIRGLSDRFGTFTIATTWGLHLVDETHQAPTTFGHATKSSTETPVFYPYFPSVWNRLVDVKLVVARNVKPRFSRNTSISEAFQEIRLHNKASARYAFKGWIDIRGLSPAAQEYFSTNEGTFRFNIMPDGIELEEQSLDL
ncbi:Similar to DNA repair protein XRCC2; acc. no. Q9CX47 [Pyronema omphalodes CBS 100304]|uniref:Similar to DNA repair protein XRCC2 acc. no. Q9CX47 n=1 Tax=Pyronema omphalodes (strain CBS 100304) TaxID=1076935 RepID=U4KXX7_PYROM|nr:Similar to DNA repair protein XRCC2; acc. no. Q9CX47 [Pyronema omphalodes CBS 100304]